MRPPLRFFPTYLSISHLVPKCKAAQQMTREQPASNSGGAKIWSAWNVGGPTNLRVLWMIHQCLLIFFFLLTNISQHNIHSNCYFQPFNGSPWSVSHHWYGKRGFHSRFYKEENRGWRNEPNFPDLPLSKADRGWTSPASQLANLAGHRPSYFATGQVNEQKLHLYVLNSLFA